MKNMFKMITEAATMKRNVSKIQAQLRQKTVDFSAGNGKITVTARCDASIANIRIDPTAMDPTKPAVLEKQILAAVEGALEAAKKASADEMKKLVAEMGLPNIPGLT